MATPETQPSSAGIQVLLVYSPAPREMREWALALPEGATVASALACSALRTEDLPAPLAKLKIGVWGQKCSFDRVLKNGDRIEIYRPLRVDPKVARRERFRSQGAKTTGLFAKNRPGAKAGY